jgi:hypothetical protein
MAVFTFSGVIGIERKRAPVASKIALATAAGIAVGVGSPAPQGCSFGRGGCGRCPRRSLAHCLLRLCEQGLGRGCTAHAIGSRCLAKGI